MVPRESIPRGPGANPVTCYDLVSEVTGLLKFKGREHIDSPPNRVISELQEEHGGWRKTYCHHLGKTQHATPGWQLEATGMVRLTKAEIPGGRGERRRWVRQ